MRVVLKSSVGMQYEPRCETYEGPRLFTDVDSLRDHPRDHLIGHPGLDPGSGIFFLDSRFHGNDKLSHGPNFVITFENTSI